jgi:hypothetical protein
LPLFQLAVHISGMRWLLPRIVRPTTVVLTLALLAACDRTTPAAGRKDTVVPVVPPPETTVVVPPEISTWDSTAGPAMFIVGAAPTEAWVIAPRYTDTTALDSPTRFNLAPLRSLQLDLFASGKRVGVARVGGTSASVRTDSCRTWPTARLDLAAADTAATRDWNVAFEAGHAQELSFDSIASLPSADSARFAADIARLASALPGDTAAMFRGLPFVVNRAWRARTPNGRQLIVAIVVRNVNQEANPRQERILLLAERDSAATTARYTTKYSERVVGLEETLEATDLVALVLLGAERRPTLIVARDTGNGSSFALIEHMAGQWQRRWASIYAGC